MIASSVQRTLRRASAFAAGVLGAAVILGSIPPVAGEATPFAVGKASAAAAGSLTAFLHDNAPTRTFYTNAAGYKIVGNKLSTVVIVNKNRNLPASYVPPDLVVPDVAFSFSGDSPKKQMRKPAAAALEKLFAAAKKDGIALKAVSGYRSYATQRSIFLSNVKKKGEKIANQTSARPGQSEHQTGLAMDVSAASAGYDLLQSFGETKEGKWLKANAPAYGFIIRYGEGQEALTGYSYEPWHIRYVGVYIAKQVAKQGLTLEQYMAQYE